MGVRSAKGSGAAGSSDPASGSDSAAGASATRGSRVGKSPPPSKKRAKSTTNSIVELVAIIAIAVLLALGIQAFIVKPYRIPSGSMEPTLKVGQRVLVNRLGMDFGKPHVGEIAVFHPPEGSEHEQCGPVARSTITFGGAACDQTNTQEETSSASSRGPGTRSPSRKGTSIATASASRTPTSNPAAGSRSATSRPRSRFRPVIGS
jgi:signal peptidase I